LDEQMLHEEHVHDAAAAEKDEDAS
jgi:hypothetical protein